MEVVCFSKEEILPELQCIIFPALADQQNDIWVTVRNGVAWLDESSKNNQVPCWGCGAATLLAPAPQELLSVLLHQMKEDTLEKPLSRKVSTFNRILDFFGR